MVLAVGFVAAVTAGVAALAVIAPGAGRSGDAPARPVASGAHSSALPEPATPAPTVPGVPGAPVVAFYGDSYTLGTGASEVSKRWSSIVCAERGWAEVNPSVNGRGFVNNRPSTPPDYLASDEIPLVVAAHPDIVFVTMGLNDTFSMPARAEAVHAAIVTDLATLRRELPDARLVVVEPFWYTDERPASVPQVITWVHEAAAALGADYIAGASHWIEGHPEWMAPDGLHPNDAGYAAMAARMSTSLTALGL